MIRKAIIPIAGLAERMRPLSAAVPKALLPLVDASGQCRCVLHEVLAEAKSAGVEDAAVVVSPSHQQAVDRYLDAAEISSEPSDFPEVTFVEQPTAAGFGNAVLLAKDFVGSEPVMVLLGDHVRTAPAGTKSGAAQLAEAFDSYRGSAVVGMQPVGPADLSRVGVAAGEVIEPQRVYRGRCLIEKPTPQTARQELATDLGEDVFLAHAGVYIFKPEIFACLEGLAGEPGELGLTEAQQELLARQPDEYYLVALAGRAYDAGYPAGYAEAFDAISATGA